MTDEAAVMDEDLTPAQSPLVSVTFQKNTNRKTKYLEAEPKALGITQIGLGVYQIISLGVFLSKDLGLWPTDVPLFIVSLVVIAAGSLAVAGQNLHLLTLRWCLGLQIVSCGAAITGVICTLIKMLEMPNICWHSYTENFTLHYGEACRKIENAHTHFHAEALLIHVALLAISATLAAYCCKVVNCCAPAPKMPVITVQVPIPQQ